MQVLTLIIPFEVPEEQEDIFRQQWHNTAEPLSHAPGFLSARLYERSFEVEEYVKQNLSGMKWIEGRFRFVAIVTWASVSHYEAAIHAQREIKRIPFPAYSGCYYLHNYINETVEASRNSRTKTGQEFTFIVPFEVPEGQEEEMRRQFQAVVAGMGHPEGSLGPGLYEIDTKVEEQLHSILSDPTKRSALHAPFRFINVAEWVSIEDYEAVMNSRRQIKPISFTGHGTYYRIAATYRSTTPETEQISVNKEE